MSRGTVSILPTAEPPKSRKGPLVPGEFLLTADDFKRIAGMLHSETGIHLTEAKVALVYSRLAKRLRALGLENFRDYCELVTGSEGLDERQQMICALTTNVTKFFREPHHFEHLKTQLLPPLLDAAKRGGRVRIWSAACSDGQEPYSIALTVLSLMPDANSYDIKILATDIDTKMLSHGRAGVYDSNALAQVPVELRNKWFVKTEGNRTFGACEELRGLVSFKELNLIGQWPLKGPFQAIFCRNVVIYFEEQTQAKIWGRFVPLIAPKGMLYIGHSERVTGPATALLGNAGITTYQKL
jgi:chemotaxis protein methyltransferase CheR